jgi:RNA polymerase sigma-70 factor (ECF subfamily)
MCTLATAPATRLTLLLRIRDAGDTDAWRQFVDLYAGVIYGFYRKRGLQDADAADLTQEVLRSVATGIGRLEYDSARGTFRAWLFTIARNRLRDFLKYHQRRPAENVENLGPSDELAVLPAPAETDEWDREYERRVLAWAAEKVRRVVDEKTWRAFWLTAVDGKSGQETADALGMSVGAVYVAKSRILTRLQQQVEEIEGESDERDWRTGRF